MDWGKTKAQYVEQILVLRLIAEKMWRKNRVDHNCFVDVRKLYY